jgi:hypothetical protein
MLKRVSISDKIQEIKADLKAADILVEVGRDCNRLWIRFKKIQKIAPRSISVQILNQDGHLSRTGLFDKIYVFSLSTSQHEDALSHEYTNLSKLEHNSIITPSHSQFKF